MISKTISILAALSTLAASGAAAAQSAQPLSLAGSPAASRAAADAGEASRLDDRRGAGIYVIGAIVLGLIIWGLIELLEDEPDSP